MFKVFASGMSSGELMPVRFRSWAGTGALSYLVSVRPSSVSGMTICEISMELALGRRVQ